MPGQLVPNASMPPLFRREAAPAKSGAAPASLRSELSTLRRAEGRLDALIQAETSPRPHASDFRQPETPAKQEVNVAKRPEISQISQISQHLPVQIPQVPAVSRPQRPHRPHRPDPAPMGQSGFVFDLDLKRFFVAWAAVCKDMRAYWRQRRNENSRRWLDSRSKLLALALWSFFGSLKQQLDQEMPSKPEKGIRVREKKSQRPGTFFSSSEKGICKILFDGQEEVCFRSCDQLLEIKSLPHPFLANLAFLAWTLSHALDEDLKIDGLRTALMFNQIMGKSSGKLTMMAVMQEEEAKGLKFCFNAWKKCMKSKSLKKFKLKKQREIFRGWLEILLMDKHDTAVELLATTEQQRSVAAQQLQRRIAQCEQVKVKVEKVHLMRLDFFLLLVFQSWHLASRYVRAAAEGQREARQALALSSLKLSEAMTKKTTSFVAPHFQAWANRVKLARKVQRAAEGTIAAMLGGSLSLVFNAWKMMKMSEFQMLQAQLQRREREFSELQEISQSFFSFSQENVERVKNMEAALQAADRALQIGAAHGDSLEVELQRLREAQKQQVEEAGTRGERLKEELERKGTEELQALAESTEKVTAELSASREMEARLQRLWQGMSGGDLEESDSVLALRQQLLEAQREAELLRSLSRTQAEELRLAEAYEASEASAARKASEALRQAEEAALEAEELAHLEEVAAEAVQERWTIMMDRQSGVSPPAVPPRATVTVDFSPLSRSAGVGAGAGAAWTSREDDVVPLGPGISTQTSMPPVDLPYLPGRRLMEVQQKYNDAWRPRGRNLIDTTNEDLMTFDLACNILSTGAYFKKKAGRRSTVKRYFFVGYGGNSTAFLKYFKDHAAAQAGQEAKGAFDLMDLVRANWDGVQNSITLTQSTKKDSSERGLMEVPETFFHALLRAVHEAEFLRQYPEHRG